MRFLRYVPFFLILLIIYNVGMLTSTAFQTNMGLIKIPLLRNDAFFMLRLSEIFAMLGIIFLFIEAVKATRTSRDTMIDHMLSMAVFVICLVEFLVVPGAGTSSFMILVLLTLVDVMLGFAVSYSSARRDISIGGNA